MYYLKGSAEGHHDEVLALARDGVDLRRYPLRVHPRLLDAEMVRPLNLIGVPRQPWGQLCG